MRHRFRKHHVVALGLCIVLGLCSTPTRADDQPDPASWAPVDALVFAGITDIDAFWERISHTAAARAMKDPKVKKAAGEFNFLSKAVEKLRERVAGALDVPTDKLTSPFGGPLALYVAAPPTADAEPIAVLIATVDDSDTMREYYEKATTKFREVADEFDEDEFAGESILYFQTSAADATDGETPDFELEPNANPFALNDEQMGKLIDQFLGQLFSGKALPPKLSLCLTPDRLYIATGDSAPIKDALRRERRGDALTESDDYKLLVRRFDPLGSFRFLVNIPAIVKYERAREEDSRKWLEAIGADSFGSVIGHAYFGRDGDEFESKGELLMLLKSERAGIAKMLAIPNRDAAPPSNVTSDNLLYFGLALSMIDVLDNIESMIRQTDPAAADQMNQALTNMPTPDGPFNLRGEVLEKLRPAQAFSMAIAKPYSPANVRFLLSIGHRDRDAFVRLIEKIRNMAGLPLMDRDFAGGTLYEMPMGGFALAPTNDELLIGSISAVESRMQGNAGGTPLVDDPAFQSVAKHVPKEAWLTIYVDSARMYEAALELAKQRDAIAAMAMTNAGAMMALQIAEQFTAGVDEKNIEDAQRLLQYQAQAIVTFSTTPDGILMTQVQSRPKAE